MTMHVFSADLAAERRRDLTAYADAYRAGAQARPSPGTRLRVKVRRLRPDDTALVTDVFAGLGPQSRLSRFLTPKPRLDSGMVRRVVDVGDRREAVVAISRWSGKGLGIAEFVRDHDDPTVAEISAAVVDMWQGRGLGNRLARTLARHARREGIVAFTALTSAGNVRVRRVLAALGDVRVVGRDGATVTYRVELHGVVGPTGAEPAAPLLRRLLAQTHLGPAYNYVAR
jgi:RimJ/RimL family protein N-acetyltransferase